MKFRKEFGRLTLKEFPLSPGTNSVKFIEDENGKEFSELIEELVNSTDKMDVSVLNLELIISIEVFHELDADARTDMAKGLWILDDRSISYRKSLTGADATEHDGRVALLKEEARRPYITMTTHCPQDPKAFANVYTVNFVFDYDLCKNHAFAIVSSLQVQTIHSIIVSAKFLKENPDDPLTDLFNTKARLLKNVYADDDSFIDDLYICIKSLR